MELPSYMPDYTGPFISNGKLQTSVEFGDIEPSTDIEYYSRLHDSAYARYQDKQHRRAADFIYEKQTGGLVGNAVLYGNQTVNTLTDILEYGKFGLLGLAYAGIKNQLDVVDWAMNKEKYVKEVNDYFTTDPFKYVLPSKRAKTPFKPEVGGGNEIFIDNNITLWPKATTTTRNLEMLSSRSMRPDQETEPNRRRRRRRRRRRHL